MRTGLRISAIGLVIALMGVGDASQGIRLKTRRLVLEPPAKARQAPKRRAVGRSHWLLEFRGRVNPERLAALADRGARVTSALSANAVAVAAADGTDFRSLGVVRTGRLEAPDKLSPLLASSRSYYHVVEFHSGVTSDDARALVAAGGHQRAGIVARHAAVKLHHVVIGTGGGQQGAELVRRLQPAGSHHPQGAEVGSVGGRDRHRVGAQRAGHPRAAVRQRRQALGIHPAAKLQQPVTAPHGAPLGRLARLRRRLEYQPAGLQPNPLGGVPHSHQGDDKPDGRYA